MDVELTKKEREKETLFRKKEDEEKKVAISLYKNRPRLRNDVYLFQDTRFEEEGARMYLCCGAALSPVL